MMSIFLRIRLVSAASFPGSSASLASGQTVHYIPGRAVLGALASRGYAEAQRLGLAHAIFHSGRVRFGPALPESGDGQPAYVLPLCLHARKSDTIAAVRHNAAVAPLPIGSQYVQTRGGFLDAGGRHLRAATEYSLRTAVVDGKARDGFLYGLESIPAGTSFLARIDFDEDQLEAKKLLDQLLFGVAGRGTRVRLGRSKTAEFGDASIEPATPWEMPTAAAERLVVLCVSDLALVHPLTGQPTVIPDSEALGLAGWRWDDARSWIRRRRISPFNAARKTFDSELDLIEAGSVLVYERTDPKVAFPDMRRGVGQRRSEGLGQVWVNPPFLIHDTVDVTAHRPTETADAPLVGKSPPAGQLASWLQARIDAGSRVGEVDAGVDEIMALLPAAGPGPGQWRSLERLARMFHDDEVGREKFRHHLESYAARGVRKLERSWGVRGQGGKLWEILHDWVLNRANTAPALPVIAKLAKRQAETARRLA